MQLGRNRRPQKPRCTQNESELVLNNIPTLLTVHQKPVVLEQFQDHRLTGSGTSSRHPKELPHCTSGPVEAMEMPVHDCIMFWVMWTDSSKPMKRDLTDHPAEGPTPAHQVSLKSDHCIQYLMTVATWAMQSACEGNEARARSRFPFQVGFTLHCHKEVQ